MSNSEARLAWIATAPGVFAVGVIAGAESHHVVAGIGISAMTAAGLLRASFGSFVRRIGLAGAAGLAD
jgi:hypothetical protein